MAAGKLILSSDLPGIRKIYGNSGGVWFFPPEDWRMLAELMQKAQKLPFIKREYLGQLNSQYIVEHYTLERWAERIGEIYRALLRERNTRGKSNRHW
jgi:glycosyltransferase involved in cell wall biosynthesis